MHDTEIKWDIDKVILAPGRALALIQHYKKREQELLEANNRYLERARAAEAQHPSLQSLSEWLRAGPDIAKSAGFDVEISTRRKTVESQGCDTPAPQTHLLGIETAPKDGTWFIAYQDGEPFPCDWRSEEQDEGPPREGWFDFFNRSFEDPTHWLPVWGATTEGSDNG